MQRSTLGGDDSSRPMDRLFGFVALLASVNIFGHWRVGVVDGLTLAPVYWNSSNPMFKPSTNSPVIEVQLRDEIDFVCPFDDSNGSDVTSAEYYVIYQVSQQEYDSCSLSAEGRRPLLIVNCNAPEARRRFTVIFEPYQSIPNVPEYKTGSTYYYTTTSSGKQNGISNTKNGACQDYNMKLSIYICCPTTVMLRTTVPSLSSTTTTTTLSRSLGQRTPSASSLNSAIDFRPSQQRPTNQQSTSPVPRISSTSASTSTTSSTSTSTSSAIRINAKPTLSIIDTVPSTKITRFPQPSYQQTADGCRRPTPPRRSMTLTTAAAVALILSFYWRT